MTAKIGPESLTIHHKTELKLPEVLTNDLKIVQVDIRC